MSLTNQKKKTVKKEDKIIRIDFGCGQNCSKDENGVKFTGVDKYKLPGVDVVHDLTKFPYPFKDNSVTEIVSNHFVEHLTGEEWMAHFDECYRILIPGGKMRVVHPYCFSVRAFQDPTHKTFIPAERYYYVSKDWREANGLGHYLMKCDFEAQVYVTYHGDKGQRWDNKSSEALQFPMGHNVNVVADLIVNLTKK